MQSGLAGQTSGSFAVLQRITNSCGNVADVHNGNRNGILQYALQAKSHTAMCFSAFKYARMEKTPDQRRELLRSFISKRGLKIARWAKESGVDKNSIYNFLNGHSESLHPNTYAKLARIAEVPTWMLTGERPEPASPTSVYVSGEVQAGVFRDAVEWDEQDWFPVDVPVPSRFRGKAKALQVAGQSMNREFPEGTIAIWVSMMDFRPPRHDDHVVVYSYRQDDTIEATLKQLRVDGAGEQWLWPQSDHPDFQAPLNTRTPPDEIKAIEIVGIVIGDYRPRHH